ncbi:MAG: adenylosuccinate lyase [Candidatus Curtissbacteria bacterium]|nr:adenylosuccinate lyase [Candidatus Curtissbacteria bacterium]
MTEINFNTYQSAFSWRYGSDQMRQLFSEINRRKTWRKVWTAIARVQHKAGLLTKAEFLDIRDNSQKIDIEKAHEIEAEIKHDLMAELKTFAAQSKIGGGKIHLGATSQDIEDNADAIILLSALEIIETELKQALAEFSKKISEYKELVCMAYTHLQPAEPTTLGYRFTLYAQDLLIDLQLLNFVKENVKGKGTKGAVGTYASYVALLGSKAKNFEEDVMSELGIEAFDVTGQVYPRKLDFLILSLLSSIAQSASKFAFDLRIMQSAGFGEWMEPFGKKQVGSSAMPFKRNPITAEKICSLARYVASLTKVSWDNAANSLLERTLDDSASRRIVLPDAFLATNEILLSTKSIVSGLVINQKNIEKNLENFGPFAAIELILLESTKRGADRQEMHEVLREHALVAYEFNNRLGTNPLFENLKKDEKITKYLNSKDIDKLSDYKTHIGLAKEKCEILLQKIKKAA